MQFFTDWIVRLHAGVSNDAVVEPTLCIIAGERASFKQEEAAAAEAAFMRDQLACLTKHMHGAPSADAHKSDPHQPRQTAWLSLQSSLQVQLPGLTAVSCLA